MDKLHCPECGLHIDEHPASCCLDAWMAEQVMEYELLEVGYYDGISETLRQKELEEWIRKNGIEYIGKYWIDVDSDFWKEVDEYKPSSSIAASLEAMEKIQKPNFAWCIESFYVDDKLMWWASFWGDEDPNNIFEASGEAEELTLAICRATIKATA